MTLDLISTQHRAHVDDNEESAVVVHVAGQCDAHNVESLAASLQQAIASSSSVVVDLAEVQFCAEAATRVFLAADSDAQARGAGLVFRHVLPPVRHALECCGLDWRIQVVGAQPDL